MKVRFYLRFLLQIDSDSSAPVGEIERFDGGHSAAKGFIRFQGLLFLLLLTMTLETKALPIRGTALASVG
jgi:hypothetical protein